MPASWGRRRLLLGQWELSRLFCSVFFVAHRHEHFTKDHSWGGRKESENASPGRRADSGVDTVVPKALYWPMGLVSRDPSSLVELAHMLGGVNRTC